MSQIKNELKKRYKKITKVSFLGFAFKGNPPTDDTRDSMSIQFYREAVKKFPSSHISIYDKLVKDEDYEAFNFNKSDNLNLSFKDANVVIILNNHKVFQKLNLKKMSSLMKNDALIYDCWNLFDKKKLNLNKKVKYSSFGNL
jgi:UDP-N-acetyl-D-mannosaminuronate dehydrogenase